MPSVVAVKFSLFDPSGSNAIHFNFFFPNFYFTSSSYPGYQVLPKSASPAFLPLLASPIHGGHAPNTFTFIPVHGGNSTFYPDRPWGYLVQLQPRILRVVLLLQWFKLLGFLWSMPHRVLQWPELLLHGKQPMFWLSESKITLQSLWRRKISTKRSTNVHLGLPILRVRHMVVGGKCNLWQMRRWTGSKWDWQHLQALRGRQVSKSKNTHYL